MKYLDSTMILIEKISDGLLFKLFEIFIITIKAIN